MTVLILDHPGQTRYGGAKPLKTIAHYNENPLSCLQRNCLGLALDIVRHAAAQAALRKPA
jgi:hypothetical protein